MGVSVGTVIANAGTKRKGFLNVSAMSDGSPINIPVIVANGVKEGPVLCVNAGCHGDEYEGIEAVIKLAQAIKPEKLKGTFIGVPVVNVPSFATGLRVNPFDYEYLDMNRIWPGREDGFITERIAFVYFKEIVRKGDYLIDLHGGGNTIYMAPHVLYIDTNDEIGKKSKDLAKVFGINLICSMSNRNAAGMLLKATTNIGIPAITVEIGGYQGSMDQRERDVDVAVKGIINVMKHLGMMDGKPKLPETQTLLEMRDIHCKNGGILVLTTDIGRRVKKGYVAARILNYFGEEVESIRIPFDGIICGLHTYPLAKPGDWIVFIGKVLQS